MCQTKSGVKNKKSCHCHNYKRMSLIGDTQRTGIAAGVEFIARPARNCCTIKI
jgi:hypothetical protein